ncbi:glucose-6-phosphate dehydrogenase assembly protein OpcA [Luteimicrobium subarcticum]|uniref:Glucose-6-phosphate dehydrogenase assembly protein OpcA n=1 Tax=Luteimicrobium subarcticum TaxID=620910 RepID=A0A2M8W3D6_9MICO|nr:glucose-6-phosphate dehydrogenase assembly protein OpcA [Luteimicrobium subarcticum]PJI85427.1 glucose-6-phosphate dehydrogenase assembly protein OpcA [Luteimicrobium subarcticum]
MIIHLPETTANDVGKRLVKLRDEGGAVTLGRVLTLIIRVNEDGLEEAVQAANDASREHPCRVIVVSPVGARNHKASLDAEIRVGGDAGASEVILLRPTGPIIDHVDTLVTPLLLPDVPIVVWWPSESPERPAEDLLGKIAHRRVTDSTKETASEKMLRRLAEQHEPGDTDLAWARVTLWRALIAAALDQPPYEDVTEVVIEGESGHTSIDLLAAWLGLRLKCAVTIRRHRDADAITRVELHRASGPIVLDRPDGRVVTISQPDQPDRHVALPIRLLNEALAEELRRLDPDETFGEVLTQGLARIDAA